jgi:hypothetical protein
MDETRRVPDMADPRTEEPPGGVCPECDARFEDGDELRAHMDRHTGAARRSEDAGGTVPDDQQAAGGAGRVQTE